MFVGHFEHGLNKGIEAKFRIAEFLGIDINCVKTFRSNAAD